MDSRGDALQRGQRLADNLRVDFFNEFARFFWDATDIAARYPQDNVVSALLQGAGDQNLGEQISTNGTLNRLFSIFAQCKTSSSFNDSDFASLFLDAHWQAHSVFPDSVDVLKTLTKSAFAIGEEAETLPEGTKKEDFNAIKRHVLVGCHLIATDLFRELKWIYEDRPTSEEACYRGCDSKDYDGYLQRLREKNTFPETGRGQPEAGVPSIGERVASYDQIPQLQETLSGLMNNILAQGLSSAWPSPQEPQGR
jgi:hypothetical protein